MTTRISIVHPILRVIRDRPHVYPAHLPQCPFWIRHIHEPEGTQDDIEAAVRQSQGFGVHSRKAAVRQLLFLRSSFGATYHSIGQIDSEHMPAHTNRARGLK
jgi:hypothetical protein